jgi:hypothetical protein
VFLTFEEACKLQVALQSTLLALNRHNRNTEIGRSLGVGIWLDTPNSALKVYEQKKSAHRKEIDAEQNGDS